MVEKETTYTPDELRAQIDRMWLRKYPDGPTDEKWLLQVGIGAGMLDVAADQIEALEAALRKILFECDTIEAAAREARLALPPSNRGDEQ